MFGGAQEASEMWLKMLFRVFSFFRLRNADMLQQQVVVFTCAVLIQDLELPVRVGSQSIYQRLHGWRPCCRQRCEIDEWDA